MLPATEIEKTEQSKLFEMLLDSYIEKVNLGLQM